jgi:hypothetical protein
MSISSIWGSCGLCFQSVVNALNCSSSEVKSSSVSGPLQSPPPIRPLPLNPRNVSLHSERFNDMPRSKVKVAEWLRRNCP